MQAAQELLREALATPEEGATHLGLITPEWQRARQALQIPVGHAAVDIYADGMGIGLARCQAVKTAIAADIRFLFFLDWDVIVPQDALLKLVYQLENNPRV